VLPDPPVASAVFVALEGPVAPDASPVFGTLVGPVSFVVGAPVEVTFWSITGPITEKLFPGGVYMFTPVPVFIARALLMGLLVVAEALTARRSWVWGL